MSIEAAVTYVARTGGPTDDVEQVVARARSQGLSCTPAEVRRVLEVRRLIGKVYADGGQVRESFGASGVTSSKLAELARTSGFALDRDTIGSVLNALKHDSELDDDALDAVSGGARGAYFVPEVGDEVLVAFASGTPRQPYVVGGLWSGKDKPPT
jgi:type VI secretion system (T6SS) baseplate-like injector VgrG